MCHNVCESAMTLTCHIYKKPVHKMKNFKHLVEKSDTSRNGKNEKKHGAHTTKVTIIQTRTVSVQSVLANFDSNESMVHLSQEKKSFG